MNASLWLIVGLGNPGKRYENTRHNMGFLCLDSLAEQAHVIFKDYKRVALLGACQFSLGDKEIKALLAKPQTFMNLSGTAVASLCKYYKVDPSHVIVIHDDMDIEFGRIKVKKGGSAGGHNGLRSIDQSLKTPDYFRVRIGVGRPHQESTNIHQRDIDWVIGSLDAQQKKELPAVIEKADSAVRSLLFKGLSATQEKFNAKN